MVDKRVNVICYRTEAGLKSGLECSVVADSDLCKPLLMVLLTCPVFSMREAELLHVTDLQDCSFFKPSKDEAQTAVFKDPVRTAL